MALRRQEVGKRCARKRECNQDVTFARQYGKLQRKSLIIAFVIGETRNNGGIGGKRMNAQSRARGLRKLIKKIVCEVIGVSATAAVAGKENLPPGLPAIEQLIGETLDRSPAKP